MCVAELGDVLALNLSSCRRLAAVWNYGFSRSSQPIGFQRLKPLVHDDCNAFKLLGELSDGADDGSGVLGVAGDDRDAGVEERAGER